MSTFNQPLIEIDVETLAHYLPRCDDSGAEASRGNGSSENALGEIVPGEIVPGEIVPGENPVQLIDVREPEELAIAHLPGFINLPLSQYGEWSGNIQTRFDPHAETVVLCHHGVRSAQMCYWLLQQGFTHVKNVAGGIDAYSSRVDPTIPRY